MPSRPDKASEFLFLDPGNLDDGVVRLALLETCPAEPARGRAPSYVFQVYSTENRQAAGAIRLRIGNSDDLRLYAGQVGYNIDPAYRGRRFAARAVQLIAQLARRHGMRELWITCDPDNAASRRTCELAGAEFVEVVELPADNDMYLEGERRKCRYRLALELD